MLRPRQVSGQAHAFKRGDGEVTLYFERSPDQRAMTPLHMLIMGGFVIGLIYGAIYGLLYAPPARSVPVALFFSLAPL